MERAFTATHYVLRVMRDGGIFAGEYLKTGSNGGFVVTADVAEADEFSSMDAAREARDSSADPGRLLIDPL